MWSENYFRCWILVWKYTCTIKHATTHHGQHAYFVVHVWVSPTHVCLLDFPTQLIHPYDSLAKPNMQVKVSCVPKSIILVQKHDRILVLHKIARLLSRSLSGPICSRSAPSLWSISTYNQITPQIMMIIVYQGAFPGLFRSSPCVEAIFHALKEFYHKLWHMNPWPFGMDIVRPSKQITNGW